LLLQNEVGQEAAWHPMRLQSCLLLQNVVGQEAAWRPTRLQDGLLLQSLVGQEEAWRPMKLQDLSSADVHPPALLLEATIVGPTVSQEPYL